MKKIIMLLFAVLLLFACDFDSNKLERIEVSGPVVHASEYLADFTEIIVAGPFEITIDQNASHGVEIETYESLMPWVVVEVIDEAMILFLADTSKSRKFNVSFDDPNTEEITRYAIMSGSRLKWPENEKLLNIVISVDMLEKIQIIGETSINTVQTFRGKDLKLEVAGAVNFDADMVLETLSAEIAGAANLKLSGKAEKVRIECAGAGTIKAYEFFADTVDVEVAGVCNAHVYARNSITAEVAGVGTIKYKGNPSEIIFDKAGLGSLKPADPQDDEDTEI
jgi:hypothetical protein